MFGSSEERKCLAHPQLEKTHLLPGRLSFGLKMQFGQQLIRSSVWERVWGPGLGRRISSYNQPLSGVIDPHPSHSSITQTNVVMVEIMSGENYRDGISRIGIMAYNGEGRIQLVQNKQDNSFSNMIWNRSALLIKVRYLKIV